MLMLVLSWNCGNHRHALPCRSYGEIRSDLPDSWKDSRVTSIDVNVITNCNNSVTQPLYLTITVSQTKILHKISSNTISILICSCFRENLKIKCLKTTFKMLFFIVECRLSFISMYRTSLFSIPSFSYLRNANFL